MRAACSLFCRAIGAKWHGKDKEEIQGQGEIFRVVFIFLFVFFEGEVTETKENEKR